MRPTDVQAHLGQPDRIYEMEFGLAVGDEWHGIVYEYVMSKDESYEHAKRWKKNRLVFAVAGRDTLLNHWRLEQVL
jgi:hypothetical protein